MSPSRFVERVLRGLARRDPTDRWEKPLLFSAGAFKVLQGNLPAAKRYFADPRCGDNADHDALQDPDHEAYLASCVKLVQYAFPDWQSSICDVGCGSGHFLRILETRGYTNCEGYDISKTPIENAVHPHAHHVDSLTQVEREYDLVCLLSILPRIPKADLDAFLSQITRIAKDRVVASLPIYPHNMMDFFDRDPTHVTLERREWWDQLSRVMGLNRKLSANPCRS